MAASAPRIELDSRDPAAVDGRQLRAVAFQDVRLAYVREVVRDVGLAGAGNAALVVGNGRGPLAGSLAALGFAVTAADPSVAATEMARTESAARGSVVEHVVAEAQELPMSDGAFGLVYVADTLETSADLDGVVREAARVLASDGVLVYDTVNRTWVAKAIYLGAFQRFPGTRIMPPGRYTAERLRTPGEMVDVLARHGLANEDTCGFKPRNPLHLVTATRKRRQGKITDEQIPPLVDFVLGGDPLVTYLGYARQTAR